MSETSSEKKKFVIKYMFQAILSLLVLIGALFLFKTLYFDHAPDYWIDKFYDNGYVIHGIYIGSEILFGLFPPEIFMFWAVHVGDVGSYILNIVFFAAVSVGAGHLAYWGGQYLYKVLGKRLKRKKFIEKYLPVIKKFGGIIIVISALTPLPWATISLIMGVINYKYRKYTLLALTRIVRFVVNGFLIYQTGSYIF